MAAGDDDWDLSAVVRSCNSASSTSSAADPTAASAEETALSCLASLTFDDDPNDVAFSFSDILQPQQPNGFHELQQAFISFLPNPVASAATATAVPEIPNSIPSRHFRQEMKPIRPQLDLGAVALQPHHRQPPYPPDFPNSPMTHSHIPKSRKRINRKEPYAMLLQIISQQTCGLGVNMGKKPIKGSPYPRNYYRCSSSKGCGARKQVERSNADPETFIITYTGDHTHPRPTHRNSLAGSSRNRSSSSNPTKNPTTGDPNRPLPATAIVGSCSSPAASPITPDGGGGGEKEREMFEDMAIIDSDNDDDDDDILIPNLTMRNEIFVGFEELGCSQRRRSS